MKKYIRANSHVINGDAEYLKFLKSISAKVNAVQKSLKSADEFEYVHFDIYLSKYNERVKGYVKVFKNKAYVELKITQNNKTIKYQTNNPKTTYHNIEDGYLISLYGGLGKIVEDYIDYCYILREYPYKSKL